MKQEFLEFIKLERKYAIGAPKCLCDEVHMEKGEKKDFNHAEFFSEKNVYRHKTKENRGKSGSHIPSVALLENYIPDKDSHLHFVCINIHFCADDSGNGLHYKEVQNGSVINIPITIFNYKEVAHQLMQPMGNIFIHNGQPSDPADCPDIAGWTQGIDSRIRPTLGGVFFIKTQRCQLTPYYLL